MRRLVLALTLLSGCSISHVLHGPDPAPMHPSRVVRPDARLAVTWIGHATTLVQLDDAFVLTDPVFTTTVGEVSERLVEPGLLPSELPPLDAVVVSHCHFDHMSESSLFAIEAKTRVLTLPEGGWVYVPNWDGSVAELRPWEAWEQHGLRVTAVPVEHNGMRYGVDQGWRKGIGYTGYVIQHDGLTVYFGGDTALCRSCFRETRARFPTIDLALLPIAPIHPRAFMSRSHMDPSEALDAFAELGAKEMVPVHFATFVNSFDDDGEAREKLEAEVAARGLDEKVHVLRIGEQRVVVPRTP